MVTRIVAQKMSNAFGQQVVVDNRPGGVMTMNPGVPANNLKEVIALAKAKPGSLNYGSPG